jgi:putative Holliday junction resolvase
MALFNMADLRSALAPGRRLIGIDPGAKRIGVALSDTSLMLATPWGQLPRGKLRAVADALLVLARREEAGGLVCGLPLQMDGTAGPAAQAAGDYALALGEATGLPVAMWDERLSTSAVTRFLVQELDATRRRRAQVVDSMAAAYMLQGALDATRPPSAWDCDSG